MTTVRNFPAVDERVETGVTQFGDDWPGIFIRGDNAFNYSLWLNIAIQKRQETPDDSYQYDVKVLEGLLSLLRSCDVREIRKENPDFV